MTLAPWLLVAAAFLFLLEILERRAGWLSKLAGTRVLQPQAKTVEPGYSSPAPAVTTTVPVTKKSTLPAPAPVSAQVSRSKPKPENAAETSSTINALRQARDRARHKQQKP